jgi:hypothetical protein
MMKKLTQKKRKVQEQFSNKNLSDSSAGYID